MKKAEKALNRASLTVYLVPLLGWRGSFIVAMTVCKQPSRLAKLSTLNPNITLTRIWLFSVSSYFCTLSNFEFRIAELCTSTDSLSKEGVPVCLEKISRTRRLGFSKMYCTQLLCYYALSLFVTVPRWEPRNFKNTVPQFWTKMLSAVPTHNTCLGRVSETSIEMRSNNFLF